MGACFSTSKQHDPDVPRCAGNSYPRNPAYANQPQQYLGAPVYVPSGGGRDHMGEAIVAGAVLSHTGFGVAGPTAFNPMVGGYGGHGVRISARTPASTTQQQPIGSTGRSLTTVTSILSSLQRLVKQGVPPGINMPGNLPNLPNPPIQGQNKDRKIIWSGMLEYQGNIKSSGPTQPKLPRQLHCQLSIGATDREINTANWPKELIMQLIPRSLLSSRQLKPLLKSSLLLVCHFGDHNVESVTNLHRTMGSGFAGCLHFPPGTRCGVRVLFLLFSKKRKAFICLIPNGQKTFVNVMRNVIFSLLQQNKLNKQVEVHNNLNKARVAYGSRYV